MNNDTEPNPSCILCDRELTDPLINPWIEPKPGRSICLECVVSALRSLLPRVSRPRKPHQKPSGRPTQHSKEALLALLTEPMLTAWWSRIAKEKLGIRRSSFFRLLAILRQEKLVVLGVQDRLWTTTFGTDDIGLQKHESSPEIQNQEIAQ